ncbi:glycosyltransferase family 4 protein [Solwaraspora sp. WMMA2101]|uniref:glycosyltransferase family 4 protein n=1 Tax=Solwaraspora sp. WMMA2101 TaxID=3404124 RepID=UPI003B949456
MVHVKNDVVNRPAPAAARGRRVVVVRVLGVLDVGGTELRTIELMPLLVEAGIELHFVTLSGREGVLASQVRQLRGHVHAIRLAPGFPARFLALLRALRPHVVHSDVATFSGAILLLAALARVPVRIAHFRSDGDGRPDSPRRRLQRWLLRALIRRCATNVVGVAPGALQHGYSPAWRSDPRCRVIPNGVDLDRLGRASSRDLRAEIGAQPADVVCLHVGRPSGAKRRWLIPPVVARAREAGLPVRAVLVGTRNAADDAQVRAVADEHRVGEYVHLLGPTEDVGALMRQADVVILPSAREGLPGAVLEAAAVGTPVVASDLPGTRFIAERLAGVTLVAPDAPAQVWAEALRRATRRRVTGQDRAAAVAACAGSDFSVPAAAAAHLAMYHGRG